MLLFFVVFFAAEDFLVVDFLAEPFLAAMALGTSFLLRNVKLETFLVNDFLLARNFFSALARQRARATDERATHSRATGGVIGARRRRAIAQTRARLTARELACFTLRRFVAPSLRRSTPFPFCAAPVPLR
ncbi:MAG TPA: hypothetical protein VER17_18285 [Tepidisphaeraceae bacterium]|nr:hypothetical protein [Tepidisphaeraceae bacterium]